jgi:multiple sugar transport system substrate-binding protein
MNARMFAARVALPVLAAVAVSAQARAADFEWKKFQGKTVTFLANNNPVALALVTYKADFEKLTGMTLKVDGYQEQQMRQRLVTVMNARSDEVDAFMTLPSREGAVRRRRLACRLSAMSKNEAATEYDLLA